MKMERVNSRTIQVVEIRARAHEIKRLAERMRKEYLATPAGCDLPVIRVAMGDGNTLSVRVTDQ